MTLETAGLLLLGACGLALAGWGVRGTVLRVGPTCRRCRYDLAASTIAASPAVRCPECGADLAAPRAVLPHLRRRRPLAMLLGVMGLASACVLGLIVGSSRFASPAVQAALPNWALMLETRWSPQLEVPALNELASRVPSNALPQADLDALVQRALALQADRSQPWEPAWGSLVESAHTSARLAPADWATYARQALELTVAARPVVQAGRKLPAKVESRATRLGQGTIGPLEISVREDHADGGFSERGSTSDISRNSTTTNWLDLETAQCGTLVQVRVLKLTIRLGQPTIATWEESYPLVSLVVPAGAATAQPIDDEEAAAALRKSLRLDRVTWSPSGRQGHLGLSFSGVGSQHPLAFEVFARNSSTPSDPWVRIGTLCNHPTGSWGHSMGGDWPASNAPGQQVDVLLRASQQAAESTVDFTCYLRAEVQFFKQDVTMPQP
ncbi:MAG: hypothetical protein U0636_00375 [Phycisphaerales bacterium]